MNEAEWNRCRDSKVMLNARWKAGSDRKRRLFICACWRRVGNHLPFKESKQAVTVAEAFADGQATSDELSAARLNACGAINLALDDRHEAIINAASLACDDGSNDDDQNDYVLRAALDTASAVDDEESERAGQANLLRCIFGNPFRPLSLDTSVLRDSVRTIARGIYEQRSFDRMPILGDALEECGVIDEALLSHCRANTPHVRGCHVVDLVLGRE